MRLGTLITLNLRYLEIRQTGTRLVVTAHSLTANRVDGPMPWRLAYAIMATPYQYSERHMILTSRCSNLALIAVAAVLQTATFGLRAQAAIADELTPRQPQTPDDFAVIAKPALDRSGKPRIGKASFYARMFAGRKMANGN